MLRAMICVAIVFCGCVADDPRVNELESLSINGDPDDPHGEDWREWPISPAPNYPSMSRSQVELSVSTTTHQQFDSIPEFKLSLNERSIRFSCVWDDLRAHTCCIVGRGGGYGCCTAYINTRRLICGTGTR